MVSDLRNCLHLIKLYCSTVVRVCMYVCAFRVVAAWMGGYGRYPDEWNAAKTTGGWGLNLSRTLCLIKVFPLLICTSLSLAHSHLNLQVLAWKTGSFSFLTFPLQLSQSLNDGIRLRRLGSGQLFASMDSFCVLSCPSVWAFRVGGSPVYCPYLSFPPVLLWSIFVFPYFYMSWFLLSYLVSVSPLTLIFDLCFL